MEISEIKRSLWNLWKVKISIYKTNGFDNENWIWCGLHT